jgi:hypothetical protein
MGIDYMRWSTWIPFVETAKEARLNPHAQDFQDETTWPMPAQSVVRVWTDDDYLIDIELRLSDDDGPLVTGIAVRRGTPLASRRDMKTDPCWPDEAQPGQVSPREVRRLPLSQATKAAVAWVRAMKLDPGSPQRDRAQQRVTRLARPPRDRSKGRVSPATYEWILRALDYYERKGELHPIQRIAVDLGEPPAKVHVWVHRAKRRKRHGTTMTR